MARCCGILLGCVLRAGEVGQATNGRNAHRRRAGGHGESLNGDVPCPEQEQGENCRFVRIGQTTDTWHLAECAVGVQEKVDVEGDVHGVDVRGDKHMAMAMRMKSCF